MHRLDQSSRVHKNGKFGTVEITIERVTPQGKPIRILVVRWDDGTVSDEDEDKLDTVIL